MNTEFEHTEGRSLIGLNPTLLEPLARKNYSDTAHAGIVVNGQTKSQWRWTVTGNADLAGTLTKTDRDNAVFPRDRAHETTASADLTATANGTLFKLPAGNASTTLTLEGDTEHLHSDGNSKRHRIVQLIIAKLGPGKNQSRSRRFPGAAGTSARLAI